MTRQSRTGVLVAVATVVAVALLAAACGIPTGGGPTAIAKADVPFHLLNPTSGSTTTVPQSVTAQTIYLVAPSQHVVAVTRYLPVPANLSDILRALLEGPTAEESAKGYQSFLNGTNVQVSATVSAGIATVNFSANPVQVVGADFQALAFAQVVFTAVAAQPGIILGASFQIAGSHVPVPTGEGVQVTGPVGPNAYLPQAPLPVAAGP